MENSNLETIIERIQDKDVEVQKSALILLHNEILSSHSSTGFKNQELYDSIEIFEKALETIEDDSNRKYLYGLLSVINLFHSDQKVLKYRLLGSITTIDEWGLQYIRQLVCCILDVINNNLESEDYTSLIEPIIEFLFKHNAEIEAIDFIFEISFVPSRNKIESSKNTLFRKDYTDLIIKYIDGQNRDRILLYLENMDEFYNINDLMLKIFSSDPTRYLVYLLKINRIENAIDFVKSIENKPLKHQCLYILARNRIFYETSDSDESHILTNSFLSKTIYDVAKVLELLPAQKLDNIFRGLDKDKAEAVAIANALVHFGYNRDPVFFPEDSDYKVKEDVAAQLRSSRNISTVASLGLINSYSHEKMYEHSAEMIYDNPDIGAILALAIAAQMHHDVNSNIFDLLCLFLSSDNPKEVLAAMFGVSLLFSCSNSSKAYDVIFPLLSSTNVDVCLFAIYVLGSIFAGSGNEGLISACVDIYYDLKKESPFFTLSILGISLLFMKNPDLVNSPLYSKLDIYSKILATGLMHVGTGNPAIADEILTESFTGDTDALLESIGLMASCLIGIGDTISTQLLERIVNSSLLLDAPHIRSVFPLSIALLYPSSPKSEVLDALERSINSGDSDVNSLIALGIVGAGTRSSKISRILESNYNNVYKDHKSTAALIISQGLVNLGKGLYTLSPLYYDKKLVSNRPLIGLLSTIFLFIDQSMFSDYSFLCYFLTSSISHKFVTGYEGTCKVGKPIDVVGFAGCPNKIGAAVVHTFPIVLNSNEKAEVDDQVYTAYIEDILIKKD